jgi:hypothetical protein
MDVNKVGTLREEGAKKRREKGKKKDGKIGAKRCKRNGVKGVSKVPKNWRMTASE